MIPLPPDTCLQPFTAPRRRPRPRCRAAGGPRQAELVGPDDSVSCSSPGCRPTRAGAVLLYMNVARTSADCGPQAVGGGAGGRSNFPHLAKLVLRSRVHDAAPRQPDPLSAGLAAAAPCRGRRGRRGRRAVGNIPLAQADVSAAASSSAAGLYSIGKARLDPAWPGRGGAGCPSPRLAPRRPPSLHFICVRPGGRGFELPRCPATPCPGPGRRCRPVHPAVSGYTGRRVTALTHGQCGAPAWLAGPRPSLPRPAPPRSTLPGPTPSELTRPGRTAF